MFVNFNPKNIAIIGASSSIAQAFKKLLFEKYPTAKIHAFSRHAEQKIDYTNEESIEEAANKASKDGLIDLILVANGILHDGNIMPEKSLQELSSEKFHRIFEINTIIPALIGKYFLPKLNKVQPSIFAVFSARVGSISDNRLGGWYSYRASKAALNMIIKNMSIEVSRKNNNAIIVALHPGTVDSNLSKPFQKNVPDEQLFTAEYSAQKLLDVLNSLILEQSGKCFAWNGKEIFP